MKIKNIEFKTIKTETIKINIAKIKADKKIKPGVKSGNA